MNLSVKKSLAAAAVALATQCLLPLIAAAQLGTPVKLKVGDASVDASVIRPYKNQGKEIVATADNRVVERGSWTDEVQVVEVGGRRMLKRTWVLTRGGKVFDTINTLADPKTFAPVMTEERKHDGEFLYFDFAGTRLKGLRSSVPPGGQPRRIEAKLGTKFFDYYGGVYDLFLATLPLSEGYAATFPAAMATFGPDADPAALDWVTIRVNRKEAVAADGGRKVESWVVDCYNAFGFFKVWVAKEPPYVMKMMIVGPGGGRITYERTQPDTKAVSRL